MGPVLNRLTCPSYANWRIVVIGSVPPVIISYIGYYFTGRHSGRWYVTPPPIYTPGGFPSLHSIYSTHLNYSAESCTMLSRCQQLIWSICPLNLGREKLKARKFRSTFPYNRSYSYVITELLRRASRVQALASYP